MSDGDTPREIFIGGYTMMHGIGATAARIHHDPDSAVSILFLDRDGKMAIRIDFKDSPATLERDQAGLRKLAGLATQLAEEIAQRQREGGAS